MAPSRTDEGLLTLGWKVSRGMDPEYWLTHGARSGLQPDDALVRVPASSMGAHTVIVAQSGSGKSFFLGRVVEEIALNTRARIVIIDPNADFRKIHEVEDASLWTNAAYDVVEGVGRRPHETDRTAFESRWSDVVTCVRTGPEFHSATPDPHYDALRLWWPALSVASLSEDLPPMHRSRLYHAHEVVRVIGELLHLRPGVRLILEAKRIFDLARQRHSDLERALRSEYQPAGATPADRKREQELIDRLIKRAASIEPYVTEEVEDFYFARADEYEDLDFLEPSAPSGARTARLEVIDLPSIRRRYLRTPAISAVIATEREQVNLAWETALENLKAPDTRVPTFIVVDEAHNLIPRDEPRGASERTLREQFRTIAAEGRKYGFFLILVSQRPDKLDRMIVSECENRAVMKIGSAAVLDLTRETLGLDDVPEKMLEKCLEFQKGRVLLAGNWAKNGPQVIYAAARRTVEGGRNLNKEHWAIPPDPPLAAPPAATPPAITP